MDDKHKGTASYFWWAKLVVAVLAIPAAASIIATLVPMEGFAQLCVFISACWICTYLGMKLMHNAQSGD